MAQRIMLAFELSIHKEIKRIALTHGMTTKAVSHRLMRDALEREAIIFARAKKKAARTRQNERNNNESRNKKKIE